jgi:hypothetical protein
VGGYIYRENVWVFAVCKRIYKNLLLDFITKQFRKIANFTPYFYQIRFKIIFLSKPLPRKQPLLLIFHEQTFGCISNIPHEHKEPFLNLCSTFISQAA